MLFFSSLYLNTSVLLRNRIIDEVTNQRLLQIVPKSRRDSVIRLIDGSSIEERWFWNFIPTYMHSKWTGQLQGLNVTSKMCIALRCSALLCVAPPNVQESHWYAFTDEVQWQRNAMRCKKIDLFVLNPGAISGRDLIESKIHKQKIHLKIIAFIDSEVQKIEVLFLFLGFFKHFV